ncbi:transcriptional regulator PhoU [Labrenzia sp. THAF82]|uniref:phosphotransferase n=1 Tax=Labrenzia sp. THAF82 TaxID=2587861 RepID=UPI0012692A3D|nr:phosphotransferase [Labrenzia sp. THAF82]QFT30285.1 transcriptional regulator PhoU [Labrenzia sp. THAF82]
MTSLPKTIRENLHFLCAEIDGQLILLEAFFQDPTAALARRIMDRAGYAHNLKTRILDACVRQMAGAKKDNRKHLTLRSLEFVAVDLQRLSNLARQSLRHVERIDTFNTLVPERYPVIVGHVRSGVARIENAIHSSDSNLAIEIGQMQNKIEADYRKVFKVYTREMRNPKTQPSDIANSLLVASEFQRMGDSLKSISEALISSNIGQAVNFERYFSLQSLMSDLEEPNGELAIEAIAETRSGSSISAIRNTKTETVTAVFKDGEKNKVKEERQGVESWHSIYPGLAPKILSYKKRNQSAALLIEHLPGLTLEHILLNENGDLCDKALARLSKTLRDIWKQTRTKEPAELGSMQQLSERLGEVRRVHPEFQETHVRFCGEALQSLDTLVGQAAKREAQVAAPFSVYIHGDFNVDNIIFDPGENRIHFIDLHRSRYMDYVQDISVFMVSNYRLHVLDRETRSRIMNVSQTFFKSARAFARKQNDDTFEFRLALGLARSFATSTRFIFDKVHARRMWLRSRYLIEKALACPVGEEARFRLPLKEIFVD